MHSRVILSYLCFVIDIVDRTFPPNLLSEILMCVLLVLFLCSGQFPLEISIETDLLKSLKSLSNFLLHRSPFCKRSEAFASTVCCLVCVKNAAWFSYKTAILMKNWRKTQFSVYEDKMFLKFADGFGFTMPKNCIAKSLSMAMAKKRWPL